MRYSYIEDYDRNSSLYDMTIYKHRLSVVQKPSHNNEGKVPYSKDMIYGVIWFILFKLYSLYHFGDFDVGRYVIVRETNNLFTF